jgi:hypothetical protein
MTQRKLAASQQLRRLARKLTAYAAGGATLSAVEAHAAIIHTDLGPGGMEITTQFSVDLNLDGAPDFQLSQIDYSGSRTCTTTSYGSVSCNGDRDFAHGLHAEAFSTNGVIGRQFPGYPIVAAGEAFAFSAGEEISLDQARHPRQRFVAVAMSFLNTSDSNGPCDGVCYGYFGQFRVTPRAYLGLVLNLPDGPHAGWADIEWRGLENPAVIFGFAYEATPREPIFAGAVPEPPSLVLLAAGAAGLAVLRCKRARRTLQRIDINIKQ